MKSYPTLLNNKSIVYLICFLLLDSLFSFVYGQQLNYLPSSPESSSLGRNIDYPIGLHTGSHNLNIPIYNLKTEKLDIPISLSYHSSGIKLQEIASRTGLGWSNNIGGMIICTVRGTPDLDYMEIDNPRNYDLYSGSNTKDIFYYSFNNKSGKFIIDVSTAINGVKSIKSIHKLDSNNIKISPLGNKFRILDDSGNEYIFGRGEEITDNLEYLAPPLDDGFDPFWSYVKTSYIATWNLEQIILANGEKVQFEYSENVHISYEKEGSDTYIPKSISRNSYNIFGGSWPTFRKRSIKTNLLTSISYRDIRVVFKYLKDRLDLQGDRALTDIKVFSKNSLRHFALDYEFKKSYNSSTSTYEQYRMFLKKIVDKSDPLISRSLYSFSYDETPMPHRKSFNMDYWGYFNQRGNESAKQLNLYIYPQATRHYERYMPFKKPMFQGPELLISGRNGEVNSSFSQAGILKGVKYETGGYVNFEYESNEFLWFPEGSSNINDAINVKGGGLRIKRIINTDSMGGQLVKAYSYNLPNYPNKTSGGILSIPIFAYPGLGNFPQNLEHTIDYYTKVMIRSFYDQNVLGTESDNVGYRYATVTTEGLGKIQYQYSYPGAYGETHDDISRGCKIDFQGICDNLYKPHQISFEQFEPIKYNSGVLGKELISTQMNTFPFGPHMNYSWNRGLLLNEINYDSDGNLVKRREIKYKLIYNGKILQDSYSQYLSGFVRNTGADPAASKTTSFDYLLGIAKVISSEKDIYQSGLSQEKSYFYDSQKLLISRMEFTRSDGVIGKTVYVYPHEKAGSASVYQEMLRRNMISNVLEENRYRGEKLVNRTVTEYSENWFADKTIIAPSKYLSGLSVLNEDVVFNAYDAQGRPIEFFENGISKSLKYSESHYPIAVGINMLSNEFFYEGFETSGNRSNKVHAHSGHGFRQGDYLVPFSVPNSKKYVIQYFFKSGDKWHLVKKPFANAMILSEGVIDDVTIYPVEGSVNIISQDPLMGETSRIDEKARMISYDYDNYGRLSYVRDQYNNILERFGYNYGTGVKDITAIYYNAEISKTFTKTNCTAGTSGGSITYLIPYGKYTGTSQSEADMKATIDINTNGQDFANAFGQCIDACEGEDKKIVNGICESGRKSYTRSVQLDFDTFVCYYVFIFSDGSRSQEYYEYNFEPCPRS